MGFFRLVLLLVIVYLIVRSLRAIIRPRREEPRVKGRPAKPRKEISADQVKDASFKDLPEDK